MNKLIMKAAMYPVLLMLFQNVAFANEETPQSPTEERGEAFQRAVDNVRERGNQQGWDMFQRTGALLFGEKSVDPLASNEELAQTQQINTGIGERAETAAQFTEAATTVVGALPTNPVAGTAGQMAVSEGTSAVVQQQTTPAPAQPSAWTRFVNWVKSWFK